MFKEPAEFYLDACREAGTTPCPGYVKAIYPDEDEDTARRDTEQTVRKLLDFNVSPRDSLAHTTKEEKQRLTDAGYAFYATDDFPRLRDLLYRELLGAGIVYVGTPKKVGQQLLDLCKEFHFNELLIVSHYGGTPLCKAIKMQELFAKHVWPTLKAETTRVEQVRRVAV